MDDVKKRQSIRQAQDMAATALSASVDVELVKEAMEKSTQEIEKQMEEDPVVEEVVEEVAEEEEEEVVEDEEEEEVAEDEEEEEVAEDEEEEEPIQDVADGEEFEMTNLEEALEKGDEDGINVAIVTQFLEEHAPEEVDNVAAMLDENKGNEEELMDKLVGKYEDPVVQETRKVAEEVTQEEEESSQGVEKEEEEVVEKEEEKNQEEDANSKPEVDIVEAQRLEAQRIEQEENDKLASMGDEERERYMQKIGAEAAHNEEKDKMLKQQLNIYSSAGTGKVDVFGGGRGRGRGKRGRGRGRGGGRPASKRVDTEYIVSGKNTGGNWSVNEKD